MRASLPRLLSLLCALACGDDDSTDAAPATDMFVPEADVFVPELTICDELGLERSAFRAGGGATMGGLAGDFTLETTDGPWVFSEEHTGCESYIFISYGATDYGNELWASVPDGFYLDGPRNAHYFLGTYETDPAAITARLATMQAALDEGFGFHGIAEEERAFWRERIHLVTQPMDEAGGSVGELLRATPRFTLAIDRAQHFDPLGSLSEIRGGGFVPNIGAAAWHPHWYNYLYELEAGLAADIETTVLPLVPAETLTERIFERTVSLPGDMGAFDTLELDVQVHCFLDPAGCSEWDRIAHVFLCTAEGEEACAETRELVRWITPYSRPGRRRWVMDASALLPLMSAGGEQTFRIVMGPEWEEATEREITINLRLADRRDEEPLTAELAFTGGAFDATYNEGREPFVTTIPADATKVEVVAIISGHGQTDGDGCAEWCNHVHTFTANESEHVIDFEGQAGQPQGCAERSAEGVVPGQWGNWAPLRAGWCPGLPVEMHRVDVTADVTPGEEATFTYRGSFDGGEPRGGRLSFSAYVVTSR